jgi:predicted DsbA family dithiol-disulfide isomerase
MKVAPNTIAVWSDLGCPWSHAVIWRLHDARRRLSLEGRVSFDHHAFPLELFNNEPTPRRRIDAEWPVARELAPRAGWQPWSAPAEAYPVTMLPPMEAVLAAKEQSLAASEELDRGLRRAFFAESRCISLRHVIADVSTECEGVDTTALMEALDDGRPRRALIDDWAVARVDEVHGSAHLFAPDGTNAQNPGLVTAWIDDTEGGGTASIVSDDPTAVEDLLRRAAAG